MLKNRQSKANFSANFAITERAKKNHYVIFFIYSFFNLHFFCILEFKIRHKNSFKNYYGRGHRHLHARKLYCVTTVILMLLHSEAADLRED